ncbi:MAG: GlsB/YeaQ/YmgE family stress response membrane protein [Candidatus Kapaibacterium sp.]|jgi:uncharacterized membrane protein YeaQ/YmgE (transglycosylase-associated protein family)
MHYLWMALIGLVIGVVAKFLTPGRTPGGCIITMVIGLLGSIIGGWLGRELGFYHEGEPAGFIVSVIGAVILLFVYQILIGKDRN